MLIVCCSLVVCLFVGLYICLVARCVFVVVCSLSFHGSFVRFVVVSCLLHVWFVGCLFVVCLLLCCCLCFFLFAVCCWFVCDLCVV